MTKKYIFIVFSIFVNSICFAQDSKQIQESLGFYPNPVGNGVIYITSKTALDKEITIYDVLGKKVLQNVISTKIFDVSSLFPGVYIIKIKEGEIVATRKLIVK